MRKLLLIALCLLLMTSVFASGYVIADQVIVSNDDFEATVVGYEEDFWGDGLRIKVQNKSTKDLSFSIDSLSCCGVGVTGFWYLDVPAGSEKSELIYLDSTDMELFGIDDFHELSFVFQALDENWFWTGPFLEEPVTLYPTGLNPSKVPQADLSVFSKGETLIDDGNYKVTLLYGDYYTEYFGPGIMVAVMNNGSSTISVAADNVSVCGVAMDPYWSLSVPSGKVASSIMSFDSEALETWGMDDIDEVSFTLGINDTESWFWDAVISEDFTVHPTGKEASEIVYPNYTFKDGDYVVVENEYSKVVLLLSLAEYDSFFEDYTIPVYVENKYDGKLSVELEDVTVDGKEADPYFMEIIPKGLKLISEIYFGSSTLQEAGVKKPSSIGFRLTMADDDSWEDLYSETFTVEL